MSGAAWTAVASIVVALITTVGLIVRSRQRPGKNDVTIPQLWERIEALEGRGAALERRVDDMTKDRDEQRNAVRVLGDGFDALSAVVERTSPSPVVTPSEHAAIARAKQLLGDDAIWATGGRPRPPTPAT